jgi:diaminopimelate epimerase
MQVKFTKMHGLGNDFVVLDLISQPVKLRPSHIKRIADRHLGIGCDQVLLIEPPIRSTADFYYRIFNANGQEVEQCGNGARCAARFFYDGGFTNQRSLQADCLAGPLEFTIEEDSMVTVNMGAPRFKESLTYSIKTDNVDHEINVVSMGNPHAILLVPTIESPLIKKWGPELSKHRFFPNETNVGFMQILNRAHIRLRVYERSVGETLACGTGACAAVVTGISLGKLDNIVQVDFLKGNIKIAWEGGTTPVCMTGPAISVFVGYFLL